MNSNKFLITLARFGVIVVLYFNISYAHPPNFSNKSSIVNENGTNNSNSDGNVIPQFSFRDAQLQKHELHGNQGQQQHQYPSQRLNLNHFVITKTSSTSSGTSLSLLSTKSSLDAIYTTSSKPSIQSAYVYKAVVPTHIEPEANKVVNADNLASVSSSSSPLLSPLSSPIAAQTSYTSNTNNYSNINFETDDDLSKIIIGSSVVTSVSVVLNGDEPEFTDALGQKVPKPQQSLQVASPIDLLNPDRYEFYTFDEHGELVKRLMTMEEIQSIVANGDGEGPKIIHHGPIEDRDPEKNVQDIVNSVQTVLNKEVESNKNSSTESLPVFDTPDVSSSWSMILPAIFGNTGNVEIFPHQKHQQIVMTPDTEIIEISTTESGTTTTKKPKLNKRKPGQKRKPTTTTTEMTPQVIQEELDSKESVYTGMQQYQNLAASMQNYDGISQLNMQPIYHKLPEIETSTHQAFINNEKIVKKPITHIKNGDLVFIKNLANKPVSVQHTSLPPHRLKKPNGSNITTKRPLTTKQKIKRKPITTTTIETSTASTATSTSASTTTSTTTPEPATITTTSIPLTPTSTIITATEPGNKTPLPDLTAVSAPTTKAQKNKKKKPTRHPVLSPSTISGGSTQKEHLTTEKRKPSPKPQRTRPKPTHQHPEYAHNTPDLAEEGTAHQEISHNKYQHVTYHKTRPKPSKPVHTTPTSTTTSNPIDVSLTVQDFPEYQQAVREHSEIFLTTRITTTKPLPTTSINIHSTSGTSGYPVPSYGISTEESEDSNFNHYEKQPLSALPLTQHASKPYDEHTLQSFDQIMQTLKLPEQMTEQILENITNVSEKLNLKPNKYDSAENKDQLEIMANKHMLPLQNHIKMQPSSTVKPSELINIKGPSSFYNSDIKTIDDVSKTLNVTARPQPEDITTNKATERETNNHSETTILPSFTIFREDINELSISTVLNSLSEKQMEKSTEYSITKQDIEDYTQEADIYGSTSNMFEQSTLSYENENTTDENRESEDYTGNTIIKTLPSIVLPHKEGTLVSKENYVSRPVFVANLKTQLNMGVIKPSEQITMSDFQTQAATVASTLVDGTNTMPTEYSVTTSNETRDEMAFLMSDVIHQMSNTNDISNTQQTNSNNNRFSNQAQLDLSFLMSPTKMKSNKTASIVDDESYYQQNYKPIYERLENIQTLMDQTENVNEESTTYFTPIELPELTTQAEAQNEDYDTELIETTSQTYTQNEDDYLMTTISTNFLDSVKESLVSIVETYQKDYNGTENIPTLNSETITEYNGNMTTLTSPISSLSQIYGQQQELEKEIEPLFEAVSSVDTTTHAHSLAKETTSSLNKEEQSSIKNQESSNNGEIKWSGNVTKSKDGAETSKNDLQSHTTILIDFENENEQASTEFLAETSEENLNVIDLESATATIEMTEGLKDFHYTEKQTHNIELTTLINSESVPNEQNEAEPNVTDEDLDRISADSVISSNQKDETTTQLTTLNKIDSSEGTTSNKEESAETTTIIYQMSEETSAELHSMISEEDETVEYVGEDPYIKLGETTTLKPELFLETVTKKILGNNSNKTKPDISQEVPMPSPLRPIHSVILNNIQEKIQPSIAFLNYGQPYDESDAEDEEDQFGYHALKVPNPVSTSTNSNIAVHKLTSTPKPEVTTTRRLSTLKPVSYFNKQPAYALYQEPLYNKKSPPPSLAYEKENAPPKVVAFTIPTPQQRPIQRPPQLSNLLISSTQAIRPPVKLEPSPNYSKGLEASLENLDGNILAFATLCNELAFSYWKSITSEKISSARSLVISPFALTSMLSMIFLGARGGTSGEMNDVLKLDDMVTFNPHLVFKNITDLVEKSMDSNIATTAFVREIYSDRANGKVLQFFKEKAQQLYASHVEEVNFHVVNDIIRRRTNLLVKRHTMGKVLEYLRTNSVWVNGPLATISANLFQTNCSLGSTQDRDGELFFQVHPTIRQRRLVPIPAVLFKSGFTAGYEPSLDATIVAFGQLQDTTSMLYIMPGHLSSMSPSDNLDRLEKQLVETAFSKKAWSSLLSSLMDRPGMEVQIPRFSHRSFINATLGLQKMGLKGLFKSDYADLGGLTGSSNRDIYLSDMIQINTFSTCGEEKIADHHHVEMYPAPPLRKRNKDVDALDDDEQDSSEAVIDFGSLVQDSVLGRGFYDDLLDPKYLELPLPLRPRQARVPDAPRLKFDKPFLYFVRHNPTGMILFMGRFNPRLLP